MIQFATQIKAIDPQTGELCTFAGQPIVSDSREEAQEWIDNHAGYLKIVGFYDENNHVVYFEFEEVEAETA